MLASLLTKREQPRRDLHVGVDTTIGDADEGVGENARLPTTPKPSADAWLVIVPQKTLIVDTMLLDMARLNESSAGRLLNRRTTVLPPKTPISARAQR